MALPKVSQVESADINTLFPPNNNTNNTSSNTTTTSSSPTVLVDSTRWCGTCNCNHPLDKDAKRKCPQWKVGMPYEDEPGYYEREDFDPERKF